MTSSFDDKRNSKANLYKLQILVMCVCVCSCTSARGRMPVYVCSRVFFQSARHICHLTGDVPEAFLPPWLFRSLANPWSQQHIAGPAERVLQGVLAAHHLWGHSSDGLDLLSRLDSFCRKSGIHRQVSLAVSKTFFYCIAANEQSFVLNAL